VCERVCVSPEPWRLSLCLSLCLSARVRVSALARGSGSHLSSHYSGHRVCDYEDSCGVMLCLCVVLCCVECVLCVVWNVCELLGPLRPGSLGPSVVCVCVWGGGGQVVCGCWAVTRTPATPVFPLSPKKMLGVHEPEIPKRSLDIVEIYHMSCWACA